MSSIIALLDIGNTSTTYGIYAGGRMRKHGSLSISDIPKLINNCAKSGRYRSIYTVISSVVPKSTRYIRKSVVRKPGVHILEVGKDIRVPIKHNYRSGNKLGIDRLVNLYGAMKIYRPPLLMIDFGTAITMDYLSKKGVFEGGLIIPGPEISFQALLERAAMIPKSLRLPQRSPSFLGKDTYSCMKSGVLEGFGSMTDEIIRRFKSRYGKSLQVVSTGGFATYLKPFSKELRIVDPQHTIKSLLLLYKQYVKKS